MKLVRKSDEGWVNIDVDTGNYLRKPIFDGKDLHHEGAIVQLVTMPSGISMELHTHSDATEVWHVLSGAGGLRIGNEDFSLFRGDTITCGPNEPHGVYNNNDEPFECVVFKLNWNPSDRVEADENVQHAFLSNRVRR